MDKFGNMAHVIPEIGSVLIKASPSHREDHMPKIEPIAKVFNGAPLGHSILVLPLGIDKKAKNE
jgi:hypothetical protein